VGLVVGGGLVVVGAGFAVSVAGGAVVAAPVLTPGVDSVVGYSCDPSVFEPTAGDVPVNEVVP
jgi:hypothetical protein